MSLRFWFINHQNSFFYQDYKRDKNIIYPGIVHIYLSILIVSM